MNPGANPVGECGTGNVGAMRVVSRANKSEIFVQLLSGEVAIGHRFFKACQCFGWQ